MQSHTFEILTLLLALPPALVASLQLFGGPEKKALRSIGTIALSFFGIVAAVALGLAYRFAPVAPVV